MNIRVKLSAWLIILCFFAKAQNRDSLTNPDSANLAINTFEFLYQPIPKVFRTIDRYTILSDLSFCTEPIRQNWKAQAYLEDNHRLHLPFESNLEELKKLFYSDPYLLQRKDEKNLMMSLWRSRIVNIQNNGELPEAVKYGMAYFLPDQKMQWTDYLYFVTQLMQEHYSYHYDYKRVKPSMPGAGDVLGITDIFRTFRAYDTTSVAGVCRDIHEVGLRVLREIGNMYIQYHKPSEKSSMDNYLYLVSWVTQSSHHVTLIAYDPLNPSHQYELDWGRLIQKNNIRSYDHGRNYGNVYRVWQYDTKRDWVKPIDFKRTETGNILDQRIYSAEEKMEFRGIDPGESYSLVGTSRQKNNSTIDLAVGNMANQQDFVVLSFLKRWQNKKHFVQSSSAFALQAMQVNDVIKKNVLFPGYDFSTSLSTLVMPRFLIKINTRPIRLWYNTELSFYCNNHLEALVNAQYFNSTTSNYAEFTTSGDIGFYSTQGITLVWPSLKKNNLTRFSLQNRSFVIPKEIRLMTVDPTVFVNNLSWVNIARNLSFQWQRSLSAQYYYQIALATEHTQLNHTFGNFKILLAYNAHPNMQWTGTISTFRRLSGTDLFWYGPDQESFILNLLLKKPKLNFSLAGRRFDNNELTIGASIQYQFQ